MVVRRIHVRYTLATDAANRAVAARVHDVHARKCPVFRTVEHCIDVTTELTFAQS